MKRSTGLKVGTTLPPLPAAIARLGELGAQAFPSVDDVVVVIRKDPSLTAALLRIANSASSAPARGVTNVYRAIVQVGTRAAIEAAMSAAFSGFLPPKLPGYGMRREEFADHSIAVGRMTAIVVRAAELDLPADPFTSGLLHDCGKLILGRMVASEHEAIIQRVADGSSWVEAERAVLDTDHTIAGGQLTSSWKLPNLISVAARFHHQPEYAAPGLEQALAAAIYIANGLVHQADGAAGELDGSVFRMLSLDENATDSLLEQARATKSAAAWREKREDDHAAVG